MLLLPQPLGHNNRLIISMLHHHLSPTPHLLLFLRLHLNLLLILDISRYDCEFLNNFFILILLFDTHRVDIRNETGSIQCPAPCPFFFIVPKSSKQLQYRNIRASFLPFSNFFPFSSSYLPQNTTFHNVLTPKITNIDLHVGF